MTIYRDKTKANAQAYKLSVKTVIPHQVIPYQNGYGVTNKWTPKS
jgi:hypothetical protein